MKTKTAQDTMYAPDGFNYEISIPHTMTHTQKMQEEVMQMLYRTLDKAAINFRAVDAGHITPKDRDRMNKMLCEQVSAHIIARVVRETEERVRNEERSRIELEVIRVLPFYPEAQKCVLEIIND